jgi:hypothetical protein
MIKREGMYAKLEVGMAPMTAPLLMGNGRRESLTGDDSGVDLYIVSREA